MRALRKAVAFGAALAAAAAVAQTITFNDATRGELPQEFEIGLTFGGPPPRWEIVSDPTALDGKALAQLSADQTDLRFPLAIHRSNPLAKLRRAHASRRYRARWTRRAAWQSD